MNLCPLSHTRYWLSRFWWGRKSEYAEKFLEVRLRWTDMQPTNNIFSRSGRRDWWTLWQPNSPRNTAREISKIITHPIIEPVQQGLILVNRQESIFSLVQALLLKAKRSPFKARCSAVIFICRLQQNIVHINYSSIFCSVSRLTFSLIFCESNDNYYCCYNWKL